MNNPMPCGLDDPRIRFEPELIDLDEDDDPRTEMEKRLSWICDEWADAQTNDSLDGWRDIRMMAHGALQALNYCRSDNRHDDRMALMTLQSVAFVFSVDCIQQGKYEEARK